MYNYILLHTSDILMIYEYIQVTYDCFRVHTNNISPHASDIAMT